jgi:hypothetical protein
MAYFYALAPLHPLETWLGFTLIIYIIVRTVSVCSRLSNAVIHARSRAIDPLA